MRNYYFFTAALILGLSFPALQVSAQPSAERPRVQTRFTGAEGNNVGSATITETANGVLIRASFNNLPPGERAIHFHESGDCGEPGSFKAAGEHLNPEGLPHGYFHEDGPHPGDLPNIHISENGQLEIQVYTNLVSLEGRGGRTNLLDENGSSLVVHSDPDDYYSQQNGESGGRIACAPLTRDMLTR